MTPTLVFVQWLTIEQWVQFPKQHLWNIFTNLWVRFQPISRYLASCALQKQPKNPLSDPWFVEWKNTRKLSYPRDDCHLRGGCGMHWPVSHGKKWAASKSNECRCVSAWRRLLLWQLHQTRPTAIDPLQLPGNFTTGPGKTELPPARPTQWMDTPRVLLAAYKFYSHCNGLDTTLNLLL